MKNKQKQLKNNDKNTLKDFPKEMRTNEIEKYIDEIKKWDEIIKIKDLKYEIIKHKFDFQQFKTIRSFGDSIYNDKINIKEVKKKQNNLFENIVNFNNKGRPKSKKDKGKKQNTLDSIDTLYEDRRLILNAFRSGIFPVEEKHGKGLKTLTPKQMLQRLSIALGQLKAGNTSKNLIK